MKTTINGYASPCAFVTKGKQRLKQNIDTVYLNNGDEFEIELFNPTQGKVLAKIELNGVSIGNGIIIRPGERIFLERYLNVAKKFLFETYNVHGTNDQVQKAIEKNGSVEVKFYNEYVYYNGTLTLNGGTSTYYTNTVNPTHDWNLNLNQNYFHNTNTISNTLSSGTGLFGTLNTSNNSTFTCSTSNNETKSLGKEKLRSRKSLETGRIEKGSDSNQKFTYDNSSFYIWASYTSKWKILPFSQKPMVKEDIKIFCVNCGKRRKNGKDKYCSSCGTKY